MREKLEAINKLRRSKTFVLVTDKEVLMYLDSAQFKSSLDILAALRAVQTNLTESIKEWSTHLEGGKS